MANENKFLTIEEAKKQDPYFFEYAKGVYSYELNGKEILIDNGKVLIQGVNNIFWHNPGHYEYSIHFKDYEVKDGFTRRVK